MSSLIISLEHTVVVVNGFVLQGWANDPNALDIPDIALHDTTRSPDGLMLANTTGMKGGIVTFKFLANSPAVQWFQQEIVLILNGACRTYDGTITNFKTNQTTVMSRGVMMNVPLGQSLGEGIAPQREYQIDFTNIITDYSSACIDPFPYTTGRTAFGLV